MIHIKHIRIKEGNKAWTNKERIITQLYDDDNELEK